MSGVSDFVVLAIAFTITMFVASSTFPFPPEMVFAMSHEPREQSWDVSGFPEERTKLIIRATQIENKEHGFYFCGDGRFGAVIEGGRSSITEWNRVSIPCHGEVLGFVHTHPKMGKSASRLSFNDKLILYQDGGFGVSCAASLSGHVTCLSESGERVERNLSVGDDYHGDPSTLLEVEG